MTPKQLKEITGYCLNCNVVGVVGTPRFTKAKAGLASAIAHILTTNNWKYKQSEIGTYVENEEDITFLTAYLFHLGRYHELPENHQLQLKSDPRLAKEICWFIAKFALEHQNPVPIQELATQFGIRPLQQALDSYTPEELKKTRKIEEGGYWIGSYHNAYPAFKQAYLELAKLIIVKQAKACQTQRAIQPC